MEDKKHIRTLGLVLVLLMLSACGSVHGPRDRPYDPNFSKGEQLFDQIPNNRGDALSRCAGHLPPSERKPHQTGRC